jgi:GNAT superfamily N-acetyltransferase
VAAVRRLTSADVDSCIAIVAGLPDHFTPDVSETVRGELGSTEAWVVADGDDVVGFAVVAQRSARAVEITWAAVRADVRARGLGTQLVDAVLDHLRGAGVQLVEVKTLDRTAGYEPYEATVAFWEARGFVQVDMIDPLPGWQPGNPSAIYVAALDVTR